eukprot:2930043-Amphidinium_carterae.4
MGQSAKDKGRTIGLRNSGSHFGLTGQQLKRMRLKQKRKQLWEKTHKFSKAERAAALAADADADIGALLATARTQVYLDGCARREAERLQQERLNNFAGSIGKDRIKKLLTTFPSLSPFLSSSILALPVANSSSFWVPGVASTCVCHALAATSASRMSNLNQKLDQEWQEYHSTVQEDDSAALGSRAATSKCKQFGYCICTGRGKSVYMRRNQILVNCKKTFPNKEQKQFLTRADAFFCLRSAEPCSHGEGETKQQTMWYHVAAMSLNPYEPTMQLMWHLPEHFENNVLEQRCVLQAPAIGPFSLLSQRRKSSFQVAEHLCAECSWLVAWYELEKSMRPVFELVPGIVTVIPLHRKFTECPLKVTRQQGVRQRRRQVEKQDTAGALPQVGYASGHVEPGSMPEDPDSDDDWLVQAAERSEDDDVHDDHQHVEEELLIRAEGMEALHVPEAIEKCKPPKTKQREQTRAEAPDKAESSAQASSVRVAEALVAANVASTSNMEPPPLPQALESESRRRRGGVRGLVGVAECEIRLGHGRISYHASKESFEATCNVHAGCVLTRSRHGRKVKGFTEKQGGRPLGLMAVWLQRAHDHETAALHKEKDFFVLYSHEERSAARRQLSESIAGRELVQWEKPKANPTEPDEPLELLGMV